MWKTINLIQTPIIIIVIAITIQTTNKTTIAIKKEDKYCLQKFWKPSVFGNKKQSFGSKSVTQTSGRDECNDMYQGMKKFFVKVKRKLKIALNYTLSQPLYSCICFYCFKTLINWSAYPGQTSIILGIRLGCDTCN